MKKTLNLLLIVSFSVLLFSGCEKNKDKDNDQNASSYFEYDGSKFSLTQAYIEYYGEFQTTSIYYHDLHLISNAYQIIEKNNLIDSISGIGNGLNFDLFCTSQDKIDTTIYNSNTKHFGVQNTFYTGQVFWEYNINNETGIVLEITDGYIKVEQNDPEYEIIIDCTLSNGKKLNGYYKGTIKRYNYVSFYPN